LTSNPYVKFGGDCSGLEYCTDLTISTVAYLMRTATKQ